MTSNLLQPKRGRNLAERVAGEFTGEIRQGKLRPGDRLPTEAEVVRRYGVSRTVVREALSQLQAAGLVETRHGVGTFVSQKQRESGLRANAAEIATVVDLLAMLELRIGVESEAAAVAARRRTGAQLEAMRSALDDFEARLAKGVETTEADFRFHALIAEATDNRYFSTFMASLGSKVIPRTQLKLPDAGTEYHRNYLASINREHEDIFNAIARGDGDGARAAMRTHIGNGRERLKLRHESSDNHKNPRRNPK
jgi:GntR family transcriptional regulator, transcriptional repressor for pyruvate dehydrogenase complex